MKQIKIFLPPDIVAKLPETSFQYYNREMAMWVLYQIQRRDLFRDWNKDYNGAELSKKYLEIINRDHTKYMKLFEQLGIVYINHSYFPGKLSKRYKIVSNRKALYWYVLDNKNITKSYCRILSKHKTHTEEQLKRLSFLKSTKINIPAVKSWLKSNPKSKRGKDYTLYQKQITLFQCILFNNEDIYLIEDRYGREHTPLTNLNAIIRDNFLYSPEEETNNLSLCGTNCQKPNVFVEYDIPTSQPRCLIQWLANKDVDKAEYKRYINTVINKDFYSEFAREYNKEYGTKRSRNDMKLPLLETMYGRASWVNKYTKTYQKMYPSIYALTSQYKSTQGHKLMAQELQRIEADHIFGWCASVEHKYFTVHDAVFICGGDYKDSFNEMVKQIGDRK